MSNQHKCATLTSVKMAVAVKSRDINGSHGFDFKFVLYVVAVFVVVFSSFESIRNLGTY